MDEVSVEAKLASEGVAPSLTVAVPRLEVQRAVDEKQEADLVLDVVRTNGQREERRVLVAFDVETLRSLINDQSGEQILFAIDPESLATSFNDVEAHGLREVGATLAIAVAAVGAGAGAASAEGLQPAFTADHAVQATVQSDYAGMPRAMPSDYAQAGASEQQMPREQPRLVLQRHRPWSVGSRTSAHHNPLRRRHPTRTVGSRPFASAGRRFPTPPRRSRTSA
jgi:hypothetical protein